MRSKTVGPSWASLAGAFVLTVTSLASAGAGHSRAQAPPPAWGRAPALSSSPAPLWRTFDWPEGHAAGGIGVDPASGRIFVTDLDADSVRAYGPDGLFEGSVGTTGDGPLQFQHPRDVAVLADGRLAVSDSGNDRVQVVSPTGEQIVAWKVGGPRGIVVVGERLYVLSGRDRAILAFDLSGTPRGILLLPEIAADAETLFWLGDVPGSAPPRARFRLPLPGEGRVLEIEEGSGRLLWAPGLPGARALLRHGAWTVAGTDDGLHMLRDSGDDRAMLPLGGIGDLEPDGGGGSWLASDRGLLHVPDLDRVIGSSRLEPGWMHAPRRVAAGAVGIALADDPAWPHFDWRGHLWRREPPSADSASAALVPGPDLRLAAALGDIVDVAVAGEDGFALTTDRTLLRWRNGAWQAIAPRDQGSSWPVAIAGVPAGTTLGPPAAVLAVLDPGLARIAWLDASLDLLRADPLTTQLPPAIVRDIAVGRDALWLLDGLQRRLVALDASGDVRASSALVEQARAVAALPDGRGLALLSSGWLHAPAVDGGGPSAAWRAEPPPSAYGDPSDGSDPGAKGAIRIGPSDAVDVAVDVDGVVYVAGPCVDPHAGGLPESGACAALAGGASGSPPDPGGERPAGEPAGRVYVLPPATAGRAAAPEATGGECAVLRYAEAVPPVVQVGETVVLTLGLAGSCPPSAAGAEAPAVAIVVEHGARAAPLWDAVRDETIRAAVELRASGATVTVVSFAERAARLLAPGGDLGPLAELLAEREAEGDTDLAAGLSAARGALSRAGPGPRTLILVASGRHDAEEVSLAAAVKALDDDRVTRLVLALNPTDGEITPPDPADVARLSQVAGSSDALRELSSPSDVRRAFDALTNEHLSQELLGEAEIVFEPHAALVQQDAPPGSRWFVDRVTSDGWQVSIPLLATTPGDWPAFASAALTATLFGAVDAMAPLPFTVPRVQVLAPATATATAPTPTSALPSAEPTGGVFTPTPAVPTTGTPTAGATPTSSAVATPSRTVTPPPAISPTAATPSPTPTDAPTPDPARTATPGPTAPPDETQIPSPSPTGSKWRIWLPFAQQSEGGLD